MSRMIPKSSIECHFEEMAAMSACQSDLMQILKIPASEAWTRADRIERASAIRADVMNSKTQDL